MPKPTRYSLSEYIKAIDLCSINRFEKFENHPKGGSVHVFKLYDKLNDTVPSAIWVIHFEHSKKKRIYLKDFKKAPEHLGITYEEFLKVIDKI